MKPGTASPHGGWRATTAATVGLVLGPSSMLVFLFGVFVAPFERAFGWSRPQILTAASIVSLVIMVVSPLQGALIDRFGSRRVVLFSTVPFAIGLACAAAIGPDIRSLYATYALLPLTAIGLWPVSYLRVVSSWFDRRLGLATGIANGGIGLGATLLPLFATVLMGWGGWRTAFLGLSGLVLAVSLPLNVWLLREADAGGPAGAALHGTPASKAAARAAFARVVRSRPYRMLLGAFFLLGFVNTGLVVNQISMLIDGGLTPVQAAGVGSAFGISVLIGRLVTGVLLDHVAGKWLMAVVCIGGAVACVLYASGATVAIALVCAVLVGTVYGAEFDVLSFLVKRHFGIAAFGRAYGWVFALFQFGAAIGAAMLPLSRAHFGSYRSGLGAYTAALLVCAFIFVLLPVPRPLPARPTDRADETALADA